MATLLIRDLLPQVKQKLRVRAAMNGRSMEAEARAILTAIVNYVPKCRNAWAGASRS